MDPSLHCQTFGSNNGVLVHTAGGKRGQGVNPYTKEAWDKLLASTVENKTRKPVRI
jgi:hypothetical protein